MGSLVISIRLKKSPVYEPIKDEIRLNESIDLESWLRTVRASHALSSLGMTLSPPIELSLWKLRFHNLGPTGPDGFLLNPPPHSKNLLRFAAWGQSTEISLTSEAGPLWKLSNQCHYCCGRPWLWNLAGQDTIPQALTRLGSRSFSTSLQVRFSLNSSNLQGGFKCTSRRFEGGWKSFSRSW